MQNTLRIRWPTTGHVSHYTITQIHVFYYTIPQIHASYYTIPQIHVSYHTTRNTAPSIHASYYTKPQIHVSYCTIPSGFDGLQQGSAPRVLSGRRSAGGPRLICPHCRSLRVSSRRRDDSTRGLLQQYKAYYNTGSMIVKAISELTCRHCRSLRVSSRERDTH